jgi:DNA-directed RNA polymerase specialized sigma24 family protein
VGQAMGKSQAAAKMLVHRGLRKLQERLNYSLEVSL